MVKYVYEGIELRTNVLSKSYDIWILKIDFYCIMKFSKCVHSMYDEKTEVVQ